MSIPELHKEWLRLGSLACVRATQTSYKELKEWEAEHTLQWEELIAYDLEGKKVPVP